MLFAIAGTEFAEAKGICRKGKVWRKGKCRKKRRKSTRDLTPTATVVDISVPTPTPIEDIKNPDTISQTAVTPVVVKPAYISSSTVTASNYDIMNETSEEFLVILDYGMRSKHIMMTPKSSLKYDSNNLKGLSITLKNIKRPVAGAQHINITSEFNTIAIAIIGSELTAKIGSNEPRTFNSFVKKQPLRPIAVKKPIATSVKNLDNISPDDLVKHWETTLNNLIFWQDVHKEDLAKNPSLNQVENTNNLIKRVSETLKSPQNNFQLLSNIHAQMMIVKNKDLFLKNYISKIEMNNFKHTPIPIWPDMPNALSMDQFIS